MYALFTCFICCAAALVAPAVGHCDEPGTAYSAADRPGERILVIMKRARAVTRRHLPTSPFKITAAPPVEQFAVQDRVTHDRYGLGRVIAVEEGIAVLVDFGSRQQRLTTPDAKLTKL